MGDQLINSFPFDLEPEVLSDLTEEEQDLEKAIAIAKEVEENAND